VRARAARRYPVRESFGDEGEDVTLSWGEDGESILGDGIVEQVLTDDARPLKGARISKRIFANAGHFLWLETAGFLPTVRSFIDRT
jgi:hypothetical protein